MIHADVPFATVQQGPGGGPQDASSPWLVCIQSALGPAALYQTVIHQLHFIMPMYFLPAVKLGAVLSDALLELRITSSMEHSFPN